MDNSAARTRSKFVSNLIDFMFLCWHGSEILGSLVVKLNLVDLAHLDIIEFDVEARAVYGKLGLQDFCNGWTQFSVDTRSKAPNGNQFAVGGWFFSAGKCNWHSTVYQDHHILENKERHNMNVLFKHCIRKKQLLQECTHWHDTKRIKDQTNYTERERKQNQEFRTKNR